MGLLEKLLGRSTIKEIDDELEKERSNKMPKCTYCGGTQFYEGPSGGMSQNILCANDKCRHWFNYSPVFGDKLDDLKRVEPTKEEAEMQQAQRRAERDAHHEAFFEKGRAAYRERKPLHTLRDDYNYLAESRETISRLCGYIEAMGCDVQTIIKHATDTLAKLDQQIADAPVKAGVLTTSDIIPINPVTGEREDSSV